MIVREYKESGEPSRFLSRGVMKGMVVPAENASGNIENRKRSGGSGVLEISPLLFVSFFPTTTTLEMKRIDNTATIKVSLPDKDRNICVRSLQEGSSDFPDGTYRSIQGSCNGRRSIPIPRC